MPEGQAAPNRQESLGLLQAYLNDINGTRHAQLIDTVTDQIKQETLEAFGARLANQMIPRTLGRYLAGLVRSIQPKRVLELGTFTGYSTQWLLFGMAPERYSSSCPIPRYDGAHSPLESQLPRLEETHLLTCSIDEPSLKVAAQYLHLFKPPELTVSPVLMDGVKL